MGLLLEQEVPLPDAFRVTAAGLGSISLARGCCRVADDVEKGQPVGDSLAARRSVSRQPGAHDSVGPADCRLARRLSGGCRNVRGAGRGQNTLLETMILPIMLSVTLVFVGVFVTAMFLPLIALIQKLS